VCLDSDHCHGAKEERRKKERHSLGSEWVPIIATAQKKRKKIPLLYRYIIVVQQWINFAGREREKRKKKKKRLADLTRPWPPTPMARAPCAGQKKQ